MSTNQNDEPSLVETEVQTDPTGPRHLTESQAAAFVELSALVKLSGHGEAYGGFRPRAKPLLMGPSGAGKTALVTRLCDTERLPLLAVNSGSWIVISAKAEPYTLHVIRRFVRDHDRGCIFLDEIDKCCPSGDRGWTSEWNLSTTTEVLSLLDGDHRLLTSGWNREDVARLRNFIIIGAGAWQRKVKADGTSAHAKRMIKDPGIPQEITYRFNNRLIVVEPPNREDFRKAFGRVHEDLGLPKPGAGEIEKMVRAALKARCGLRWVEQYVSDLLSLHPHLRRQPDPVAATKQGRRVIPAWEMRVEHENLNRLTEAAEPAISHLKVRLALLGQRLSPPSADQDTLLELNVNIMTPEKWEACFNDLIFGLHSRYYLSEEDLKDRHAKLWLSGKQVRELCRSLLRDKSAVLEKEQILALVVNALMRVSRIISALSYLGTVELFEEQAGK
jgi:hypothetical protein